MTKKFSPRKNSLIGRHEYGPFIEYLNDMSASGFHVHEIGRFVNTFDNDKSERYIYTVCREESRGFFVNSEIWEMTAKRENICFYRRRIPSDSYSVKAKFVDIYEEEEWLEDLAEEGYLLCGKSRDEYFFTKSKFLPEGEYVIEKIGHREDIGTLLEHICVGGARFICCSPSGYYYFFTPDEQRISRKKYLRQAVKHSSAGAFLAGAFMALSLIVCAVLLLFNLVSEAARGLVLSLCLSCFALGCVLLAVSLIRTKHLKNKYIRLLESQGETLLAGCDINASGDTSDHPTTVHPETKNNTPANTEVPTIETQTDTPNEFEPELPAPDADKSDDIPEPKPEVPVEHKNDITPEATAKSHIFSKRLRVVLSLGILAIALIYCVIWFNRLLPSFISVPVGLIGFIISISIILAFPFRFYSHLGK